MALPDVDCDQQWQQVLKDASDTYRKETAAYQVKYLDFAADPSSWAAERVQDSIGSLFGRIFEAYLRGLAPDELAHCGPALVDRIKMAASEINKSSEKLWATYFTDFRRKRNRALGVQPSLDELLINRYVGIITKSFHDTLKAVDEHYQPPMPTDPAPETAPNEQPSRARIQRTKKTPDENPEAKLKNKSRVTRKVAGQILGLSERRVRELIEEGQLDMVGEGHSKMVTVASLKTRMNRQK